jgi:hypothetical protein
LDAEQTSLGGAAGRDCADTAKSLMIDPCFRRFWMEYLLGYSAPVATAALVERAQTAQKADGRNEPRIRHNPDRHSCRVAGKPLRAATRCARRVASGCPIKSDLLARLALL